MAKKTSSAEPKTTYLVRSPVRSGGERIGAGGSVDLTDADAQALLALGASSPIEPLPPEPPPAPPAGDKK